MVNFKTIQKIHKKVMYLDKCDVYRFKKIKKSNGATNTQKTKEPIYQDIPCKISFNLRTWDVFTHKPMDTTLFEKEPKIFMEVEYHIQTGDYLVAKRYDTQTGELLFKYEGQAGVPQVSWTHQEILLDMKGDC